MGRICATPDGPEFKPRLIIKPNVRSVPKCTLDFVDGNLAKGIGILLAGNSPESTGQSHCQLSVRIPIGDSAVSLSPHPQTDTCPSLFSIPRLQAHSHRGSYIKNPPRLVASVFKIFGPFRPPPPFFSSSLSHSSNVTSSHSDAF
ncbi:hypothetical protein CRG98_044254 [Punica granatum]|uniref:Uncharacterized protein n=1 Tax=Punica granatum TaxID=22663 RepID=A0A2I0HUZ8_PUNGR|nr:hypothetical protein CRG98_044254 [Punica granatum]